MLSTQKGKNELIIEFGCGTDLDSMVQKIAMKIDTGADMNAINKTTFKKLFPNTKLQPSTVHTRKLRLELHPAYGQV